MELGFEKFTLATICRMDAAGLRGGPETKEEPEAGPAERWCLEDQDGGSGMDSPCVWEAG